MPNSLKEFSQLMLELDALVNEWKNLTPEEKERREEEFRNRQKGIAVRIGRLS